MQESPERTQKEKDEQAYLDIKDSLSRLIGSQNLRLSEAELLYLTHRAISAAVTALDGARINTQESDQVAFKDIYLLPGSLPPYHLSQFNLDRVPKFAFAIIRAITQLRKERNTHSSQDFFRKTQMNLTHVLSGWLIDKEMNPKDIIALLDDPSPTGAVLSILAHMREFLHMKKLSGMPDAMKVPGTPLLSVPLKSEQDLRQMGMMFGLCFQGSMYRAHYLEKIADGFELVCVFDTSQPAPGTDKLPGKPLFFILFGKGKRTVEQVQGEGHLLILRSEYERELIKTLQASLPKGAYFESLAFWQPRVALRAGDAASPLAFVQDGLLYWLFSSPKRLPHQGKPTLPPHQPGAQDALLLIPQSLFLGADCQLTVEAFSAIMKKYPGKIVILVDGQKYSKVLTGADGPISIFGEHLVTRLQRARELTIEPSVQLPNLARVETLIIDGSRDEGKTEVVFPELKEASEVVFKGHIPSRLYAPKLSAGTKFFVSEEFESAVAYRMDPEYADSAAGKSWQKAFSMIGLPVIVVPGMKGKITLERYIAKRR